MLHLVKPLLGVQAGRLALGALRALAGRFGGVGEPAADAPMASAREQTPVVSPLAQLATIVGCQAVILLLATGGGRYPWLLLVYPRRRPPSACSSAASARSASTCGSIATSASARCDRACPTRSIGSSSTRST